MATQYTKLTLTLTCRTEDEEQITTELNQALDILGTDFSLFDDDIDGEVTNTPAAVEEDEDDDET